MATWTAVALLAALCHLAHGAWPAYEFDRTIAPGKLVLTMLIKNEKENLERSLPKWAKIADFWVIGVDDANTDESPAIIRRHLGHIPGRIVKIHFDGMGPSWTVLVEEGLRWYPEATHGILADADFTPLNSFDKRQLDHRCRKHMFTIRSPEGTLRRMDWVYRNLPGVTVQRRTHQMLIVPEDIGTDCPALDDHGHQSTQTMLDLVLQEYPGGYQDRTPGKQQRYISWLLKDLDENPGDGRSLYYLGMGYLDLFLQSGNTDRGALDDAISALQRRADIEHSKDSYYEERWFAMMKLGEVHERYLNQQTAARRWYQRSISLDPARADGWFYLGQNFRLHSEGPEHLGKAWENLAKAASLPLPERSLFQWMELYSCLRYIELLRCAAGLLNRQREEQHSFSAPEILLLQDSARKGVAGCSAGEVQDVLPTIEQVRRLDLPKKGIAKQGKSNGNLNANRAAVEEKPAEEGVVEGAEEEEVRESPSEAAERECLRAHEDWTTALMAAVMLVASWLGHSWGGGDRPSVVIGIMLGGYGVLALGYADFKLIRILEPA
eukprot:TRINITY_DN36080_c0_g1_i1.p1 TRINITY_DN36080_c0_g1~~TRINITY_DN36080_c0_g1_i1.p1  ORF type:complete len:551 (+),score=101.51 TRINITY_DN36080_c0_g1_i1:200-1852(+)